MQLSPTSRREVDPTVAGSEHSVRTNRKVVACVGSSSTAGKGQAFDWIGELSRRTRNSGFRFVNFGVGGDLAYNALHRLQDVVACRPDKVVIWVGSNDVLARVSSKAKRFYQLTKHLPVEPTLEWFRLNIEAIACRLQNEASASVAFCSLPPIGEDPDSADPFQSELNQLLEKYSAMIMDVASRKGVGYIPLHEAMLAQIHTLPRRALTSFRFLPLYRDAFRTLILRRSPDEVARMNGWLLHTDGVHLNSRGGMIAADLIQEFIDR